MTSPFSSRQPAGPSLGSSLGLAPGVEGTLVPVAGGEEAGVELSEVAGLDGVPLVAGGGAEGVPLSESSGAGDVVLSEGLAEGDSVVVTVPSPCAYAAGAEKSAAGAITAVAAATAMARRSFMRPQGNPAHRAGAVRSRWAFPDMEVAGEAGHYASKTRDMGRWLQPTSQNL